jgi:carbon storage regulator CsrA
MLVLARRNSESVVVGDPGGRVEQMLKVTVLEIGRGRVRLGFEVAGDVPVNRWEVWQRIRSSVLPEGEGWPTGPTASVAP